uniref:Tubulintyrosine ligase family putative n=1 Tax=Albugo laibachii Nc14 TaxID=890382 RepID=F0WRD8_9STRA|nr:tubulintyrosine ligase family putative [Albugo laibachii Nc14]|eukprot:CCA23901.1 tubulintyrosine ligase family putative [Albugo laibachii Nc14]
MKCHRAPIVDDSITVKSDNEPLLPKLPHGLYKDHKKPNSDILPNVWIHLPELNTITNQSERHSNQTENEVSEMHTEREKGNIEDSEAKQRIAEAVQVKLGKSGRYKDDGALRLISKGSRSQRSIEKCSANQKESTIVKLAGRNRETSTSNVSRNAQNRATGSHYSTPQARDFATWKKRHGVTQNQKVFCVSGCYPIIRQELEKRGWFCNEDRNSPFFHLKWSLKSEEIKMLPLDKHQHVNHFLQNTSLTTKVGLLQNLRHLVWHQNAKVDSFFPQAFDLNEPQEMNAFVQQFRYVKVESMLKKLAKLLIYEKNQAFNLAVVDVILAISRKQLRRIAQDRETPDRYSSDMLEESIDHPIWMETNDLVSDVQWQVLKSGNLTEAGNSLDWSQVGIGSLDNGSHDPTFVGNTSTSELDPTARRKLEKEAKRYKRFKMEALERERKRLEELFKEFSCLHETTREDVITLAISLEKENPQFHLNGGGILGDPFSISNNIWIIKPAGMSRGRGIRVFNELDEILSYADIENHKECQWVAQKYMENPLLVCRRKFDIRQWVLVTCWDPLTVWFNKHCYLRFSSEEYQVHDLSDPYVHLTNNSIQKQSDKFYDVYTTDDGKMTVEGNMWHSDDFIRYLACRSSTRSDPDLENANIWEEQIQAEMKRIVIYSLQCVQDLVQHRANSFELYGYDFMLDDKLAPWLIEVNSSPACDYSTPTAQRYVETGLADIIKVVVDYRDYEQNNRNVSNCDVPSTGCWVMIHKGAFIGRPFSSFGADFHIKGSKLTRRSKHSRKVSSTKRSKSSSCGKNPKMPPNAPKLSRNMIRITEGCGKINLVDDFFEESNDMSDSSATSDTSASAELELCADSSSDVLSLHEKMLL